MSSTLNKITLSELSSPQPFEVTEFKLSDADTTRLKVLGICQGREIRLVQIGSPLVVEVLGTQVGVSKRIADGVVVKPR